MKKQTLSKLFLACGALLVTFACQPKQPTSAPVPPPQVDDSQNCTDQDECSEGAMGETAPAAEPAAATETATPAVEPEAAPVAAEAQAAPAESAPAESASAAPAVEAVQESAETTSAPAPEVAE